MINKEHNNYCESCGAELMSDGKCIKCGKIGKPSDNTVEDDGKSDRLRKYLSNLQGRTKANLVYRKIALVNLVASIPLTGFLFAYIIFSNNVDHNFYFLYFDLILAYFCTSVLTPVFNLITNKLSTSIIITIVIFIAVFSFFYFMV